MCWLDADAEEPLTHEVAAQFSAALLSHVRDSIVAEIDIEPNSEGEVSLADYESLCTRATSLWARLWEGVKRKGGDGVPLKVSSGSFGWQLSKVLKILMKDDIAAAAKILFSKAIESLSEGTSDSLCSQNHKY